MTRDAIVLAGGRGRRLGGVPKATLEVGGARLLDRALDALGGYRVVVVGPEVPLRHVRDDPAGDGVLWAREEPPFGGPAAALLAGLEALADADTGSGDHDGSTTVLAVDLVDARAALTALEARIADTTDGTDVDGWVGRDPDGRRQPLLAVYRTAALRRAGDALTTRHGASVRDLLAPLRLREVELDGKACADIDTPAQLTAARHPDPTTARSTTTHGRHA